MYSRTQMYEWSKLSKEGWTELENMQRLHLQGKLWPGFLGTQKASYMSIF